MKASPPATPGRPVLGPGDVEQRNARRAACERRSARRQDVERTCWRRPQSVGIDAVNSPRAQSIEHDANEVSMKRFSRLPGDEPATFAVTVSLALAQAWPGEADQVDRAVRARRHDRHPSRARSATKLAIALGAAGHHREQARRGRRHRCGFRRQGGARWLHDHGRHDQHHTRSTRRSTRTFRTIRSKDFVPITLIARVPNMLVVNPDGTGEERGRAHRAC